MQSILDFAGLTTSEKEGAAVLGLSSHSTFINASSEPYAELAALCQPDGFGALDNLLLDRNHRRPWSGHTPEAAMMVMRHLHDRLAADINQSWPQVHTIAIRWGDPALPIILEAWRRGFARRDDPLTHLTEDIEAFRLLRRYAAYSDDEYWSIERSIRRKIRDLPPRGGWMSQRDRERYDERRLRATDYMMEGFFGLHGQRVIVVDSGMALELHIIPKLLGNMGVASDNPEENPQGYQDWSPQATNANPTSTLEWGELPGLTPDVVELIYRAPVMQFFHVGDYYLARHLSCRWDGAV